jgi:hypothetical protein
MASSKCQQVTLGGLMLKASSKLPAISQGLLFMIMKRSLNPRVFMNLIEPDTLMNTIIFYIRT